MTASATSTAEGPGGYAYGIWQGAVTLEEKDFGVSVKFTPTVLGNGRINTRRRKIWLRVVSRDNQVRGVGANHRPR